MTSLAHRDIQVREGYMLFIHKDADKWVHIAVYTGARPKGSASDYVRISEMEGLKVWRRVGRLALALDVPQSALSRMARLLRQWIHASSYDLQQENIYQMMSPQGMQTRQDESVKAEWRYYNNYTDLALALFGEVESQGNLSTENSVSATLLQSNTIRLFMLDVARKITVYAEEIFPKERDKLVQGKYKTLHPAIDSWAKWKSRYESLDVRQLIPVLYDITMSFKAPFQWTEQPMDQGQITKDNMRMNVSTPEEDFYWTSRARWANVPIWAAPSYTAQLMLLVAHRAGAETNEIQAFAYGISAYWNQCYPHTATPVHRMYGVMTAAQEFGVPPEACDPKTMYQEALRFSFLREAKL